MDTTRAKSYGINNQTSLYDGLKETIKWFLNNKELYKTRNNYFTKTEK
jgi:dTDP-D-glucose 4,6-dehydratase